MSCTHEEITRRGILRGKKELQGGWDIYTNLTQGGDPALDRLRGGEKHCLTRKILLARPESRGGTDR